ELALRLRNLRLEGAGVDLREQLALTHELALAEERLQELAVDAAADGDGVERRDGAERGEGDGQIAGASEGDDHRRGARPRGCRSGARGRAPPAPAGSSDE